MTSILLIACSTSQAQWSYPSNEKEFISFTFKGAIKTTINNKKKVITVLMPKSTKVDSLVATFTTSPLSRAFVGESPAEGVLAKSGKSPIVNYRKTVTWVVEAENHSWDWYWIKVIMEPKNVFRKLKKNID